ncbi:MAG TPA: ATP-binding cassette domain-containing protein, partial [Paracoccaceae bacterium]|nr:ATP-binding cassette domain-containing protein [Paracoccaceae bacterium]
LKLDPSLAPGAASGGERRRAALARVVAAEPELMLLDEPTNHLDIEAVLWLEAHLGAGGAAFVLISHDRAFLRRLTQATLWIDRGEVRRQERGFEHFEEWRDKVFEEEDAARHKLDRLLKAEGRWAVEGISARRRRNMGRVRRLEALRAERRAEIQRAGVARMELESGPRSGRLVIEAKGIAKRWGGREILGDFSIRIARGERVAIVGPNGVGKTTLLNILTGAMPPDAGEVRLGTGLAPALFDQNRAALDPAMSLWESLTGDPEIGVGGRSDQVMVRGSPRHVVAYLKDFLFDERQARGPVAALSGGEKARLILARIMARASNLLILDEPTNDLDLETLDLLQELLDEYDGTVLLVSHDRDFLDRVATTTIAMEGDGRALIYAGGWSDYRAQRGERDAVPERARRAGAEPAGPKPARPEPRRAERLSFKQQHRLAGLPGEIERLAAEISRLEAFLADPDLYAAAPEKFAKASEGLLERQARMRALEEEWFELESLREAFGN